jgi:glycosyltransferase involved in cell wall biosynthesis
MRGDGAMRVHFFEPPAHLRVGGLDAAIQGMRAALTRRGVAVDAEEPSVPCGEVVHFHGLWQPAHSRLSHRLRARGIPYVVSPHGMLEPWAWRHKWWKKWPYFHLVETRHLRGASALLATGPMEASRLQRFARPRQRIEWLPLGLTGEARPDYVRARQQLGWAPEEQVLLFLSRLHVKKGPDILLRALASMKWPRVTRLVVVGDGDRHFVERLKRYASEHADALPRIDWAGAVWGDARWKYFQGADLFCLPTHSENFGLAVLEALQVGTPVLTTVDTPWASQLPRNGGHIAVPLVSSVRAELEMFFYLSRLTPAQRAELSEYAHERFAWERLAHRYVALYESVPGDQMRR